MGYTATYQIPRTPVTSFRCALSPALRDRRSRLFHTKVRSSGDGAPPGPRFYYRTYDNMQWKLIDLGRIDFARGAAHAPLPLYEAGLGVKDVTPKGR